MWSCKFMILHDQCLAFSKAKHNEGGKVQDASSAPCSCKNRGCLPTMAERIELGQAGCAFALWWQPPSSPS